MTIPPFACPAQEVSGTDASGSSAIPAPLDLTNDPIVGPSLELTTANDAPCSADGATGSNIAFEQQPSSGSFLIEEQRGGAELVEAGIVQILSGADSTAAARLVDQGLFFLEWGFAQEVTDASLGADFYGTFCFEWQSDRCATYPTADAWHSAQLFVEDAAWAMVLLRDFCAAHGHPSCASGGTFQPTCRGASPAPAGGWLDRVNTNVARIQAALAWFELGTPGGTNVQSLQRARHVDFTHRSWLNAAMFANASDLLATADPASAARYAIDSAAYTTEALGKQWPDGTNPEGGDSIVYAEWPPPTYGVTAMVEPHGFDGNYQGVGLKYASHMMSSCAQSTACQAAAADLFPRTAAMAVAAFSREQSHFLPEGEVFCEPFEALDPTEYSSKACSRDPYERKTPDYPSLLRGFAYWARIEGTAPWLLSAVPPSTVASSEASLAGEACKLGALNLPPLSTQVRTLVIRQRLQFPATTTALVFNPVPAGATTNHVKFPDGTLTVPFGLPGYCPTAGKTVSGAPTGLTLTVEALTGLAAVDIYDSETVHLSVPPESSARLCSDAACTGGGTQSLAVTLVQGRADFWATDSVSEQVTVTASSPSTAGSTTPTVPTVIQFIGT
jgi:hypothetical protein